MLLEQTGYWAALLRRAGADVLAFDEQPPTLSSVGAAVGNRFFNRQFTEVLQAESVGLFQRGGGGGGSAPAHCDSSGSDGHGHRTLMMIFPENPLHVLDGEYTLRTIAYVWDISMQNSHAEFVCKCLCIFLHIRILHRAGTNRGTRVVSKHTTRRVGRR